MEYTYEWGLLELVVQFCYIVLKGFVQKSLSKPYLRIVKSRCVILLLERIILRDSVSRYIGVPVTRGNRG